MSNTVDKVILIAETEVGYLEKSKSAYQKDHNIIYEKTKGAGSDNYTKYGKEMHDIYPSVMDFPAYWCDAFVDYCFYKAYGVANAKGLLGGDFNDYTVGSKQLYVNKKAYVKRGEKKPQIGWQIFFTNGTKVCHTGLVYKVDIENGMVYTIEGNTSGASGIVPNGGGVCKKQYSLTNKKIDGYGVPNYDKGQTTKMDKFDEIVIELKKAINSEFRKLKSKLTVNAKVDSDLIATTPTLNKKTRAKYPNTVKAFQKLLNYHGYKVTVDGDFYTATEKKLKEFQKNVVKMQMPDGEVTAKMGTWKALLKK